MHNIEQIKAYFFSIGIVILIWWYLSYNLFSRELSERTGLESYTVSLILLIGGVIVWWLILRIIIEALQSDSKKNKPCQRQKKYRNKK